MIPARLGSLLLAVVSLALAGAPAAFGQAPQPPAAGTRGTPGSTTELDRNDDKVPDYRVVYDRSGAVSQEEMDYDLNGAMDTFYYYTNGVLQREEIDSDGNGKVDIWVYLLQGTWVQRYERDTNGDGKPDLVRDFGKG